MTLNSRLFNFCNTLVVPFSMQRWASTPQHNAAIGGALKSYHLSGNAIDLSFDTWQDLESVAQLAVQAGFGGVEVDLTNFHLHLDTRTTRWHVRKTSEGYTPLTPSTI